MSIDGEQRALREFLLGVESENDGEKIGARLIDDPNFAAEVEFAEETLIEQFLDGLMSEKDRELFLRNFLTSEARTSLMEEIVAIRSVARPTEIGGNVERESAQGFLSSLRGLFGLKLLAAGMLVLLIAMGVWRFGFTEPGLNDIEKSFAALNSRDLNDPALTSGLSNQSLSYGTLRGNSAVILSSSGLSETVLFRLALPAGTTPESRFDLELRRSGQVVFRQKSLRSYQNPNGGEVKVILPRSVLQKGSYQLKLGEEITYAFEVE